MSPTSTGAADGIFEVEQEGDTLVVIPAVDLRDLEYQWIESDAPRILDLRHGTAVKNLVMDFFRTDYAEGEVTDT